MTMLFSRINKIVQEPAKRKIAAWGCAFAGLFPLAVSAAAWSWHMGNEAFATLFASTTVAMAACVYFLWRGFRQPRHVLMPFFLWLPIVVYFGLTLALFLSGHFG